MSRVLLMAAAVLLVTACAPAERSAEGIVTAIDTLGLSQVQGFTLRTEDGRSLHLTISDGTDLGAGGFPPDHLREHMATASGVAVVYRTEGDTLVAIQLTDAAGQSP